MRSNSPHRLLVASLWGAATCATAAQWSGYVFNGETRVPVSGALVKSTGGLQATTDANGAYALGGVSLTRERLAPPGWDPAGRSLVLALDKREAVRLEAIDLSGRILSIPFEGLAGPGIWRWSANTLGHHPGLVALRLVQGGRSNTWTLLPGLGSGLPAAGTAMSARSAAATVDTLTISRIGFETVTIPIPAGDSLADTAWLASNAVLGAIPWNGTIKYGSLKDARDNKTYRTVQIGSQTWMAQNLNFKQPSGSDTGRCYLNKADSCTKYGRLYTWSQAMDGQVASPALPRPATGICPTGWHLASKEEWNQLASYIGTEPKVRRALKSISGWKWTGSGSDAYGFRALPGGFDMENGFANSGLGAYWWTSSAGSPDSTVIGVELTNYFTPFSSTQGYIGRSVRCVQGALGTPKDTILSSLVVSDGRGRMLAPSFYPGTLVYRDTVPWTFGSVTVAAKALDPYGATVYIHGTSSESVSVPLGANGTNTQIRIVVRSDDGDSLVYQVIVHRPPAPPTYGIPWQSDVTYGTVVDGRDGHVYRTTTINGKVWMAQNLDYKAPGADSGFCQPGGTDTCAKYGRLYTWETAMANAASSDANPSGVKGVCPAGWHLPSNTEWNSLKTNQGTTMPGYMYKSTAGWAASLNNGSDFFGFRAVPAGWYTTQGSSQIGEATYWWSSTYSSATDSLYATGRWIKDGNDPILTSAILKSLGLSVRCVKN